MKIIEVKDDGKGGAIYQAPNVEQFNKIMSIIKKAYEELESKNEKE